MRFAILRGLVQVLATASSITPPLPPEASSPCQLASVAVSLAWPDGTSSPRSDSSLFEALQPQMKRAETQFAEVASDHPPRPGAYVDIRRGANILIGRVNRGRCAGPHILAAAKGRNVT